MPAKLDMYKHRNELIGRQYVYVNRDDLARLTADGKPIHDGTVATIVDAFDFDYPFMYRLEDGRRIRYGGRRFLPITDADGYPAPLVWETRENYEVRNGIKCDRDTWYVLIAKTVQENNSRGTERILADIASVDRLQNG